jgi:hypothetical protein
MKNQILNQEPQEALLAIDKNLLLIPAYKVNGESLYFFIKDKDSLGASFVRKGILGWRAGMLSWGLLVKNDNNEKLSGYQGHGENLLYGLIKNGEDRFIEVNGNEATILNLEALSLNEVKENGLEGLYIWNYKSDTPLDEGEIKLFNKNNRKLLDTINFEWF